MEWILGAISGGYEAIITTDRSLGRKIPNGQLICAEFIFLVGIISAFLLLQFSEKNAMVCVFWMALLTGCMHGVNQIMVCAVPVYFKESGNVFLVSGILYPYMVCFAGRKSWKKRFKEKEIL